MSAPATLTAVSAQAISCDRHANRAVHVAGWVGCSHLVEEKFVGSYCVA